ncbi:MAG: hypothetical protein Q7J68_08590, partial [Thermoplasmata archaeon]|nr:hypothetical protein [Thermoplasmata archaeon]
DNKVEESVKANKSQEDSILDFLNEHEAVRTADDSPWAPELIIQKFWPKNTDSMTGDDFKKLFFKNPDAKIIMSEDLILRAQQNGVKAGTWLAVRDDQIFDKTNVSTFSAAFTSATQIILTDTDAGKVAREQFYCDKCQKRKTECKCGKEKCKKCGKTLDVCSCKESTCPVCGKALAVCGGNHGPTTIPPITEKTLQGIIGELLPILEDKDIEAIQSIALKAKGRDDLSRLLSAIPQFLGAKVHYIIEATLNEEHKGGNFMQLDYKGDDAGFKVIKPVLLNYQPKEQFSSCDLVLTFSWDGGISRDEFVSILRDKVANFTGDSIYTAKVTPKEAEK